MNWHWMKKNNATTVFVLASMVAWSATAQEAPWVGETLDGRTCTGGSAGNFGPYDYMTNKAQLPVVENRHFTTRIEQLQGGETTQHAMGDVNYTLTKFPNHHRALYTAVRFSLGEAGGGSRRSYPAECYLQRANYFSPKDAVPYMLYGLYLHQLGQLDQSLEKYQSAEMLAPDDPNLLYNMGLVTFDRGNFEESQRYAIKAYDNGMALPGLKRKLQSAGYWE
jgi:tetratricopeptide (TPR) repeat protein